MLPTTDFYEQPRSDDLEGFDRFTPADFFIALVMVIVLISLAILYVNFFVSTANFRWPW